MFPAARLAIVAASLTALLSGCRGDRCDAPCPSGFSCLGGECLKACADHAQCAELSGTICVSGYCTQGELPPMSLDEAAGDTDVVPDSDGDAPAGDSDGDPMDAGDGDDLGDGDAELPPTDDAPPWPTQSPYFHGCLTWNVAPTLYVDSASDLEQLSEEDCLAIDGDLTISGPSITSVSALSGVVLVRGAVLVEANYSLESLGGLYRLAEVGSLVIYNNPALWSVSMAQLERVRGLFRISLNASLRDVAFGDLDQVDGDFIIRNNANLPQVDAYDLADSVSIGGETIITNNQP